MRLALFIVFLYESGETHLKLSYSKPVYMARLVQEDNKHGETRLKLMVFLYESGHVYWLAV
jgi:hypothetical protein